MEFDAELLKNNLQANKISVSNRGGNLRISVNVFNTSEDINQLIDALEASRKIV